MHKGIDCATPIPAAVADKLAADGVRFVARYIAGTTKRILKPEAQLLSDRNLLINSCYETVAERVSTRVGLDLSAARGKEDGLAALNNAQAIGQPDGTYIYFAIDYDAREKDFDCIEIYLRTANLYIPKYRTGVYGPQRVLTEMHRRGACVGFWQACAWSDGKVFFNNNMHQVYGGKPYPGLGFPFNVDYDEAPDFDGMWRLPPTIVTPKQGDTVTVRPGAKQYGGGSVASFVYNRQHVLSRLTGDKALITFESKPIYFIKIKDLIKL